MDQQIFTAVINGIESNKNLVNLNPIPNLINANHYFTTDSNTSNMRLTSTNFSTNSAFEEIASLKKEIAEMKKIILNSEKAKKMEITEHRKIALD